MSEFHDADNFTEANLAANDPLWPYVRAREMYRNRLNPKGERFTRWEADQANNLRSFLDQRRPVLGNSDLSPDGKAKALAEFGRTARQRQARLKAENATLAADLAESLRIAPHKEWDPAYPGLVTRDRKRPEHTTLAEQRHAEIRTALRELTPFDRDALYLQRLDEGGIDDEIVQAIERAPAIGAPLITPAARDRGQQLLVERSPLAGSINEMQTELKVREALALTADMLLKDWGAPDAEREPPIIGSQRGW